MPTIKYLKNKRDEYILDLMVSDKPKLKCVRDCMFLEGYSGFVCAAVKPEALAIVGETCISPENHPSVERNG